MQGGPTIYSMKCDSYFSTPQASSLGSRELHDDLCRHAFQTVSGWWMVQMTGSVSDISILLSELVSFECFGFFFFTQVRHKYQIYVRVQFRFCLYTWSRKLFVRGIGTGEEENGNCYLQFVNRWAGPRSRNSWMQLILMSATNCKDLTPAWGESLFKKIILQFFFIPAAQ